MMRPWILMALTIHLAALGEGAEEAASSGSAIDPKRIEADGMAALRESDGHPERSITAALAFAKALAYYREHGDTDKVCELQAEIYWCKKRMNLDSLRQYVAAKDADTKVLADSLVAIADTAVPTDQSGEYMIRAQHFAESHPDQYLLIAIRYFEVADRFVGTAVSLQAQRLSLENQRKAGSSDAVGRELKAIVMVPGELPDDAAKVLTDLNTTIAGVTSRASLALGKETESFETALGREAEAQQRKGDLKGMLACQKQLSDLSVKADDLPKGVQVAQVSYLKAKEKVLAKAQSDIIAEKVRALKRLDAMQAIETKKGNTAGALAIKNVVDQYQAELTKATAPKPTGSLVVIPANSEGVSLGKLDKGRMVSLQYVEGVWGDGGALAGLSPDGAGTPAGCKLQVIGPNGAEFVPANTKDTPWVFKVKVAGEYLLRTGDSSPAGNPGAVTYRVDVR